MLTTNWRAFLAVPAALSAAVLAAGAAVASEVAPAATLSQIESYRAEGAAMGQVTSVSQLTDVRPTDWAFQALQSLVERYGCIVGYPDRTYRGNQALTRYEFAAGLNACLDRINELIAAATGDLVKQEDLDAIRKLQEEFAAELATLRGRVDSLEARTTTLEKQQFSTTTKLRGEAIFAIADTFGEAATQTNAGLTPASDDRTNTIFANRVRLTLNTSFTGKDLLVTRLQARNITSFSGNLTGTNMTRLGFDGNEGNNLEVDKLYYRFPLGDAVRIQINAIDGDLYDYFDPVSPLASSGGGAISRFGRFNPVFRSGDGGLPGSSSVSADIALGKALKLQTGILFDRRSNEPTPTNGLFNGGINYAAQVVFQPSKQFKAGLMYVRSYYPANEVNVSGSTGSSGNFRAQRPFGNVGTTVDAFAAQVQFSIAPQFIIGGWFGAQFADQVNSNNDATILNGAVYAAFPDLGGKGNLGAILVGVPPKVTSSDLIEDPDTSIHIEGLYRYRLNSNISITPGVIVILDPEHRNGNDTQFVGVIRTTFSF